MITYTYGSPRCINTKIGQYILCGLIKSTHWWYR